MYSNVPYSITFKLLYIASVLTRVAVCIKVCHSTLLLSACACSRGVHLELLWRQKLSVKSAFGALEVPHPTCIIGRFCNTISTRSPRACALERTRGVRDWMTDSSSSSLATDRRQSLQMKILSYWRSVYVLGMNQVWRQQQKVWLMQQSSAHKWTLHLTVLRVSTLHLMTPHRYKLHKRIASHHTEGKLQESSILNLVRKLTPGSFCE